MAISLKDYIATKHKGLFIHKQDINKFLFSFRLNGKNTRKVFHANPAHGKADKLKTAYAELEKLKSVKDRVNKSGGNLNATIDEYFDKLQVMTDRNEDTKKAYELYYKKYIQPVIGTMKIADVAPTHITAIMTSVKNLSNSSRQKAIAILVPIFKLAIDEELIQFSPIKSIHRVKRKQIEEKKIVTGAETKYRKVHDAINTVFADNHKIRALFLFGFNGRRKTEALQLKWSDIDFTNNNYTIRGENSKINTDMTFKLPMEVKEALLQCEHFSDYIFASNRDPSRPISEIREHITKIKAVTYPEYNFHWMRNLAVSALSSMGVEAIHLSAMLGHTDTNTVKQYLSLQRETSSAHVLDASKRLLG